MCLRESERNRLLIKRFHYKGVYGDCIRVKILYQKKDSALVQMNDATQAQLGEMRFMVLRSPFLR